MYSLKELKFEYQSLGLSRKLDETVETSLHRIEEGKQEGGPQSPQLTSTPKAKSCASPDTQNRYWSQDFNNFSDSKSQFLSRRSHPLTRSATDLSIVPTTQTLPKLLGGSCAEILTDSSYKDVLVPKVRSHLSLRISVAKSNFVSCAARKPLGTTQSRLWLEALVQVHTHQVLDYVIYL